MGVLALRWKLVDHFLGDRKFYYSTLPCTSQVSPNDSTSITDILGSCFVQWEEVEARGPYLFTAHLCLYPCSHFIYVLIGASSLSSSQLIATRITPRLYQAVFSLLCLYPAWTQWLSTTTEPLPRAALTRQTLWLRRPINYRHDFKTSCFSPLN